MDIHLATEIAYKNGFKDGTQAAYKAVVELLKDIPECEAAVHQIEKLMEVK